MFLPLLNHIEVVLRGQTLQLRADVLNIEAGGPLIVVMNRDDSAELGVISSDRVFVRYRDEHAICILNISTEDEPGIIGIYGEVKEKLGVKEGDIVLEKHPYSKGPDAVKRYKYSDQTDQQRKHHEG